MKVYFATPMDLHHDHGATERGEFLDLIRNCGFEVCGPGIGEAIVLNLETATLEEKKRITYIDLDLLKNSDAMVIVTDMKVPSVGVWMEAMMAHQWGKPIIVLLKRDQRLHNIYLETFSSRIIYNSKDELTKTLEEIKTSTFK